MASAISKNDAQKLLAYAARRKAERRAAKTATRQAASTLYPPVEPGIAQKFNDLPNRRAPSDDNDCSIGAIRQSLNRLGAMIGR